MNICMKFVLNKKTILLYLLIIDLLFLPYFKPIKSSFSSVILLGIFLLNIKNYLSIKKYYFNYIFFVFVFLSFCISIFKFPDFVMNNLSRLVILTLMILVYIYFKENRFMTKINIKKILYIYLIFTSVLALIYFIDVGMYFGLKNIWSLNANYDSNSTLNILNRFCGIMSDPNNCACVVLAICSFLDRFHLRDKEKIIKNICTIFIVFMTMSVTGIICLIVYFIISVFISGTYKRIKLKKIITTIIFTFILLIVVEYLINSDVGKNLLERITINTTNNDISRINIWINMIRNLDLKQYIFSGFGGTILINNMVSNPHNGLLYFVYNYGMIATFLFCYTFIHKVVRFNRNEIYYIFFFINFILNTVVIDYRATMIYVILFVFSTISRKDKYYEDSYLHSNL